jgi:hypothetical protein
MNLVGKGARKDDEFEINPPGQNPARIPTGRSQKPPSDGHYSHVHHWLTIIGKDANLPAGTTMRRKRQNGEQAWP